MSKDDDETQPYHYIAAGLVVVALLFGLAWAIQGSTIVSPFELKPQQRKTTDDPSAKK